MNAITQAIVNQSTLELVYIKITNATKDTFVMSIETNVSNTGPIGATISPMTVDMNGPGGVFGRLNLPQIKTKSSGTVLTITDELIQITNMDAFVAFNKSIMQDEELILKLENGNATIKAMFMTTNIIFQKNLYIRGMNGPKTSITETEIDGVRFKNTMTYINPSPLETDLGIVRHEIRNSNGAKIAEQQGKVYLQRGESSYVMMGSVTGEVPGPDPVLVGVGVVEDNWNNLTIINFKTPLTLTEEFVELCKAKGKN